MKQQDLQQTKSMIVELLVCEMHLQKIGKMAALLIGGIRCALKCPFSIGVKQGAVAGQKCQIPTIAACVQSALVAKLG